MKEQSFILILVASALLACGKSEPKKQSEKKSIEVAANYQTPLQVFDLPTMRAELASSSVRTAWWELLALYPKTEAFRGFKAETMNADWVRATEITEESIPAHLWKEVNFDVLGEHHSSVVGDFNGDGKLDEAIVGVYETKQGEFGNFIAVLTEDDNKNWKIHQVLSWQNNHKKAKYMWILKNKDERVWVGGCYDCDAISFFVWDKASQKYQFENPFKE